VVEEVLAAAGVAQLGADGVGRVLHGLRVSERMPLAPRLGRRLAHGGGRRTS